MIKYKEVYMMKQKKIMILIILISIFFTIGCGNENTAEKTNIKYRDGVYVADSTKDEWGGKVSVTLIIKNGTIAECDMKNLDKDGQEKGDDYGKKNGKIENEGIYKIAQEAVKNSSEYTNEFLRVKDIELVEVVSGATVTYNSFKEAIEKCLQQAKE